MSPRSPPRRKQGHPRAPKRRRSRRRPTTTGPPGTSDPASPGRATRPLPAGTVTFLFTDIEGSTRLLRELGPRYAETLAQHRRLIRDAAEAHGGIEVDTQGDAFFVAFASANQAVAAAAEAQAALSGGPVRVRMGLHTGEATVTDEGYVGLDVHVGARIGAAAHGGQVVISASTRELLDEDVALTDLGEHRVKDFERSLRLFQLGDDRFAPLKTLSTTNLPRPASTFLGREREIVDIVARVRNGDRFLTLTGPGGSGKTRLAIECATDLLPDFTDGVTWVPLVTVLDPDVVVERIGAEIGGTADVTTRIGDRRILLVLDNLEQVVEAGVRIAGLVEACANLHVIATSRERLRVRGEVAIEVAPLVADDAVRLFCDRSGLSPDDDVAALCAALDELPLAIELAAARTNVLTPAQILERLSERLDLLAGDRDAEARQATLRATISWSHDLLDDRERRLFSHLAVFASSFAYEAAEAICDADVDTLGSLVDKSLLRHAGRRFSMLETIRAFASERLDAAGDRDELVRRHFDHHLALARSAHLAPDDEGPQRHDLVRDELGEMDTAFDRAMERGAYADAATLAVALENILIMTNPFDAERRMTQVLEHADELPPETRARALRELGGARHMTGDLDGSRVALDASLAIFRDLDDRAGVAHLLHRLANCALAAGDLVAARAFTEDSIEAAGGIGEDRPGAFNLGTLGDIEWRSGARAHGVTLMERSASLGDRLGSPWWAGVMSAVLAWYELQAGHLDNADRWSRASLPRLRIVGDRQNLIYAIAGLAWTAAERGDHRRAGVLWGAIESEEARGPIGAWDAERELYAPHATSDDPGFVEGRREGRGLSLDEAVAFAMS